MDLETKICEKKLIQYITNILECNICYTNVNDLYECDKCHNNFCKKCITDWLKKNKKCPLCNSCLLIEEMDINYTLFRIKNNLPLKCPFYANGCVLTINFGDYQEHIKKCDFKEKNIFENKINIIDIFQKLLRKEMIKEKEIDFNFLKSIKINSIEDEIYRDLSVGYLKLKNNDIEAGLFLYELLNKIEENVDEKHSSYKECFFLLIEFHKKSYDLNTCIDYLEKILKLKLTINEFINYKLMLADIYLEIFDLKKSLKIYKQILCTTNDSQICFRVHREIIKILVLNNEQNAAIDKINMMLTTNSNNLENALLKMDIANIYSNNKVSASLELYSQAEAHLLKQNEDLLEYKIELYNYWILDLLQYNQEEKLVNLIHINSFRLDEVKNPKLEAYTLSTRAIYFKKIKKYDLFEENFHKAIDLLYIYYNSNFENFNIEICNMKILYIKHIIEIKSQTSYKFNLNIKKCLLECIDKYKKFYNSEDNYKLNECFNYLHMINISE